MLVLTRKKGETIRIGDSIVVKVISCGHGRTKIGIEAPAHCRLLRGELAHLLDRPNPVPPSPQRPIPNP